MITKVHGKNKIRFQKGDFANACKMLEAKYGPKGLGWDNLMTISQPGTDFEEMTFAINYVTKWECFDIIREQNDLDADDINFCVDDKYKYAPYYRVWDIVDFLAINGVSLQQMKAARHNTREKGLENIEIKTYFDRLEKEGK